MVKNNTKTGTLINFIIAAGLTALFVVAIRLIYSFTYGVIDDPFIETMLSGAFSGTPTDLVVYIKLPLAYVLKSLLILAPGINWHFHFLVGCFVISVFLVVFRICSNVRKLVYKLILSVLFVFLFTFCLAKLFVGAHYSMCAAVLTGTAIFYFLTIKYDSSKFNLALNYIVCLLLLYTGYSLRARTLFMLMPLAFVAFLYKFFQAKPAFQAKNIIRWIIFPILLFIGIGAIEVAHASAYKSDEWKQYLEFNDARTTLYDFYGVPAYEGNEAFYDELGIRKERVYMYKDKYYLELDDGVPEGTLQKIADYAVKTSYEKYPLKERIGRTLKALPDKLTEKTYSPMSFFAAGLVVLILLIALFARKWRVFVHILLSVVAFLIPWVYMIYMGKPVARVTSGIYYGEILFALGLIVDNASLLAAWAERKANASKTVKVVVSLVLAVVLAAGMGFGISKNVNKINRTTNKTVETGKARLALNEWCQERLDNLYICESEVINLGFIADEMEADFVNLYYPGGWPATLPQGKEVWDRYGITSMETAIAEQDNVYIVAFADTDMTYWVDFYKEKYPKVSMTLKDSMNLQGIDFCVYSISGELK